jgi:hypothetical protein
MDPKQEALRLSEKAQENTLRGDENTDSSKFTLAFYAAARGEILLRISMRETCTLAWVATCGVLIGLAVKDEAKAFWIAFFLPVISFAFF